MGFGAKQGFTPLPTSTPVTELARQVLTDPDDGYRSSGSGGDVFSATSYLIIGNQYVAPATNDAFNIFLRFLNILVAQATTIKAAYLVLTAESDYEGHVIRTNLYGNLAVNPVAPTNVATFDALVLTAAFVPWDNIPGFPDWAWPDTQISVDITPVIQEIVDQAAWVSGQALQLVWKDDGSDQSVVFNYRTIESAGSFLARAPILYIYF